MKLLKALLVLLTLGMSVNSQAYTIFSLKNQFDWNTPTDVFVVGYGKDVGTLFLNTAVSRARKHLDAFGDKHQTLIIWAQEKNYQYDTMIVSRLGLKPLYADDKELDMSLTLDWLDRVQTITSLHFVGHSSAWNGFGLQHHVRFNQEPKLISRLRDNFAKTAYLYLHGCNTGYVAAPEFSRIFRLPVLASLSSTDFKQLHSNGS